MNPDQDPNVLEVDQEVLVGSLRGELSEASIRASNYRAAAETGRIQLSEALALIATILDGIPSLAHAAGLDPDETIEKLKAGEPILDVGTPDEIPDSVPDELLEETVTEPPSG